jgi:WD40 repeat protein
MVRVKFAKAQGSVVSGGWMGRRAFGLLILLISLVMATRALLPAPPQRGRPAARPSPIQSLAFSRDGRTGALFQRNYLSLVKLGAGSWKERWRTGFRQGVVTALDFSPDGTKLAAGITAYRNLSPIGQPVGYYVMIRVFDVETGRILQEFTQSEAVALTDVSFAFDPSPVAVVTRGGDEILVWNTGYRALTPILSGQQFRGFSAVFALGGNALALAVTMPSNPPKFNIRLYDTLSGQLIHGVAQGFSLASYHALAVSPDGRLLAAGLEGWNPRDLRRAEIRLYDLQSQRVVGKINKIDFPIESLVFSEDAKTITATGFDRYRADVRPAERTNRIGIWDVETEELQREVEAKAAPNQSGAMLKKSLLIPGQDLFALIGNNGVVSLYETKTAELIATVGSTDRVGIPTYSRESPSPERRPQRAVVSAHRILDLSVNNGGRILAGSSNGVISAWDIRSGRIQNRITLSSSVQRIALSPDTRIMAIAGSDDGSVSVLEAATGKLVRRLGEFSDTVGALAFSPAGEWLAAGDETGAIRVWRTRDWEMLGVLTGHAGNIRALAFSPDATLLASGGEDMSVRLWRMGAQEPVHILQGHRKRINALAFSADGGTLASGGDDATILIWNVDAGGIARKLSGHSGSINSICFAPDHSFLVSGGDESIRVWDAASGKLIKLLTERAPTQSRRYVRREAILYHNEAIMAVTFSPDGKVLACGGVNNAILLWDAATWDWRLFRL